MVWIRAENGETSWDFGPYSKQPPLSSSSDVVGQDITLLMETSVENAKGEFLMWE